MFPSITSQIDLVNKLTHVYSQTTINIINTSITCLYQYFEYLPVSQNKLSQQIAIPIFWLQTMPLVRSATLCLIFYVRNICGLILFFIQSISFMITDHDKKLKTKKIIKEEKALPSVKKSPMQQLPQIQDLLNIPKEEREQRCDGFHQKMRPFIHQYAQKKTGSRVLQLIFKWGRKEVKQEIYSIIKKHWKDLIKSKYALYLIQSVAREYNITEIAEDVVLLQGSWEGAKIVQAYLESSGDEGARLLKNRFYQIWEKSKSNDLKAQQTLHNLSLKVIQKKYDNLMLSKLILRLSIGSMFTEQKQKVLQYLVQKVSQWVSDEDGVRLFFEVINHSDPKMKKQLIRSFKTHVKEIVQLKNQTYVALVKLLTQVDDTVFLQKTLQSQIQDLFPLMSSNKHAFAVIFSIFSPRNHNFNILGKYEHTVIHTQCKKSEQVRKKELRNNLYEPLLNYLSDNELYHLLRHHINNKLVIAIYKSLEEDNSKQLFNSFISRIATLFLQDARDALQTKTFSQSLAADPSANKILKQILLLSDEVVDYFCDQFGKLATRNIMAFLESKASFVLLGLIEKGGRDYLLQQVKRHRKHLQKAIAGEHYLKLLK